MNFKALNFDNDVDVDQTIALFKETYGDSFPIRKIYTQGFWRENGASAFKTIVGVNGRQIVCSVSVRPEPGNTGLVQLAYLAAKPDFSLDNPSELNRLIRAAAGAYNARYVYSALPSHLPNLRKLTAGLTPALALMPEYLHNFHPNAAADSVLGSIVIGAGSLKERQLQTGTISAAYVPKAHKAFIEALLTDTGIQRDLVSDKAKGRTSSISADARGLECKYFPKVRALQAIIQPSLLSASEIRDLQARKYSRSYIFVNAADPAVSECAEQLESHGYRFSGFIPAILGGRDALVYTSAPADKVDSASFGDERAATIVNYLAKSGVMNVQELLKLRVNMTGANA